MIAEPPNAERLRQLFRYDPETGDLLWRRRPREDFVSLRGEKVWNARYAGKVAGYIDKRYGHREVAVDNRHYRAHRVIWCMMYGYWPDQIDHEEHNRADNRIEKLRDVSDLENKRNLPLPANNTSGAMGVTWDRSARKWRAQISLRNTCKYLGIFADKAEAIARRKMAEIEYGFHSNHGRAEKS